MAIPAAEKVQERTGIPWQAIVAVSANETGWGKAVAGNNYFGIKGSNPDTGANTGQVGTWEVINGQRVNIKDTFRAYNGYQDSAMDFARFLQTNARYQPAMSYLRLHPSDWRGFLRMVHDAGYATDPNWSNQVINIGNGLDGVEEADPTRPSKLGHDRDTGRVGMTGLLNTAADQVGSKYVWGGAGGRSNFDPNFVGSDCSGFVAWAYNQATGLKLPAQTQSMFQNTANVRASDAMPGDLVFYNMGEGAHMEHVGIYAGNGMMIHDSSINPNGGVDITPLWQGAQFRRVNGVDPSLYSRAQGGGLRSSPSDVPTEWVVTVEHGRQIATLYTSSGIKKDDLGKANDPDGTVLGHSGEDQQQMGTGADEADPDLMQHLGGGPGTPGLGALVQADMGKPYVFGAAHDPQNNPVSANPDDHDAYDCSSFVSSVARRQGYNLTPYTDAMYDQTAPVKPGEETAGDLIFYQYNDPTQKGVKFPHVGFYLGNGRTYEARYDKKTGGGVGEYDQLDPRLFKPVYRRMIPTGAGQDDEEDDTDYSFLDTPLSPDGEIGYQIWKRKYAPKDSGWDYDLRGAYAAGLTPDPTTGHWPDTYKKPNHPTFSDQSKFAKDYPDRAGSWNGDQYVKPQFLNPSTGSYEPIRRMGSGQDEDEYFLNPATGNYELVKRPDQIPVTAPPDLSGPPPESPPPAETPDPTPPPDTVVSRPINVPYRAPISQTAPNRLKPGESLDLAMKQGTVPETLASGAQDVGTAAVPMLGGMASAAGGLVGGAASALGTKARETADTAGAAADWLNQQTPGQGAVEAVQAAAPAVAEAAGQAHEAAQELGAQPVDLSGAAQVPGAAAEAVSGALGATQQGIADEAAIAAQDPGQAALDLAKNQALRTGMGMLGPMGMPAEAAMTVAPGVATSIDWMRQNGYDSTEAEAAAQKLLTLPDFTPSPASQQLGSELAAGRVLGPQDLPELGGAAAEVGMMDVSALNDMQNNFSDYRKAVARGAQAPEIRDTPEGQWASEGAAFVTDPTNLLMLADPALGVGKIGSVGRAAKVIEEGTTEVLPKVLTSDAAKTAADGLAKHAPEFADFVRPLTKDETTTVLQRAALDLNDSVLEQSAKAVAEGERFEPITGDQARREVMNAVARTNPGADAQTVLDKTDAIMRGASLDILGDSERAGAYGASLPDRIGALRELGLAPEAVEADRTALGLGSRQAGAINTKLAIDLAGGAAGGYIGTQTEDPNDPQYAAKVASKALIGLGSTAAVVHGAAMIPKATQAVIDSKIGGKALEPFREFFAPTMNLTPDARKMWETFAGDMGWGVEAGRNFGDRVRNAWGKYAYSADTLAYIERTGRLPSYMTVGKDAVADPAAARAVLDDWKKVADDFSKLNIIPKDIDFAKPGSKAKLYVPHAVESDFEQAVKLGKGRNQPGRVSSNPFWNYTQERIHETLDDGMLAGVTYSNDLPKVLGNYYSAGLRAQALDNMVAGIEASAKINNPKHYGKVLGQLMTEGEDIVRIPKGTKPPSNATWLGDIKGIGNKYRNEELFGAEKTYVSPELADVFKSAFDPQGFAQGQGIRHIVQPIMSMNSALKHNTLSGSLFHLTNEWRQYWATQGTSGLGNMFSIVKGSVSPGEFRAYMSDATTRGVVEEAMRNGLSLNTLAEQDVTGTKARIATTLLNVGGGALVGSQASAAAGGDLQDQIKWGAAGAAMGLATTAPGTGMLLGQEFKGMATKSLVETVSESLWNRTIPMMKLSTYEMYAPQYGGKAAAEFANTVFGGNNLEAIARSRNVQDGMRMLMLAPDWTESWARLIGTSVLNTPTGEMSRAYWSNAAMQSLFLLEGMNLALGGQFSWQNDPDHVLEVDATNLYNKFGWKTTDAKGNKFTPYIDVLGPYKGLLQPVIDLGRASTVAAARAAGVDPMNLPGGPAIAGYFPKPGEPAIAPDDPASILGTFTDPRAMRGPNAIPQPDPGEKLKNFASARGSMLGTGAAQFLDDHDFAGRPLDRSDDNFWQQAINRVNVAAQHMLPTGITQVIKGGVSNEPWQTTLGSAVTGARLSHGGEAERFFDMQDQFVKDAGKDPRDWQAILDNNRNANAVQDQMVANLINGVSDPTATYGDRGKSISTELGKKKPESQVRKDQIKANLKLSPATLPEDQRLRQEIGWLDDQNTNRGADVPADLDISSQPKDYVANLVRMAWNRDPNLVADLQAGGRRGLASHPGLDAAGELNDQRKRWTADVAATYGIDYDVLQDMLKAQMYGDTGGVPPPIPGVTSGQLDDIINGYANAGKDPKTQEDLPPNQAQMAKETYLARTVAGINAANPNGPQLDQANLARRIQLRKLPVADQTPDQLAYDRAEAVRQKVNMYDYVGEDGKPLLNEQGQPSTAQDWQRWDQQLLVANNPQQKHGSTYIQGDPMFGWKPDEKLNQLDEAKRRATALATKQVLRDPSITPAQKDAYFQWEGEGSALNPEEWKQFKAGTLDEWSDAKKFPGGVLPKDEWDRRVAATRLWNSLTREEKRSYDDQNVPNPRPLIEYKGETDPLGPAYDHNRGTLAEYMAYLGRVRNKNYAGLRKIQGLDPDQPENVFSGG